MALLVTAGIDYFNPSLAWAYAPLIVPKAGPEMFKFNFDLRPMKRFTIEHQFPMPNIEHELSKV